MLGAVAIFMRPMRWIYRHYVFLLLFLFIAFWLAALLVWGPEAIIKLIGVENSYAVAFILAAIAGLTSFTGSIHFTALATFAAGGADPFLLGLVGGTGLFLSDSLFFYAAQHGRHAASEQWGHYIERLTRAASTVPRWAVPLGVFLYVGFSPFPNDILMLALALGGFRYRLIFPALFLASITHVTLIAHFGEYALEWLTR